MAVEPSVETQAGEGTETRQLKTFQICPPLLEQGKMTTTLALTDLITAQVAVSKPGGETVFHYHTGEDQIFLVLAGQARFYRMRIGW